MNYPGVGIGSDLAAPNGRGASRTPSAGDDRWLLMVSPLARAAAGFVWAVALVTLLTDAVSSILAGQIARTIAATLAVFCLVPAWHWLRERRRLVRIGFSPALGWTVDRLGPIQPPRLLLDAGSWMLLALQPADPSRLQRSLWLPLTLAQADERAWVRLRQTLAASVGDQGSR